MSHSHTEVQRSPDTWGQPGRGCPCPCRKAFCPASCSACWRRPWAAPLLFGKELGFTEHFSFHGSWNLGTSAVPLLTSRHTLFLSVSYSISSIPYVDTILTRLLTACLSLLAPTLSTSTLAVVVAAYM